MSPEYRAFRNKVLNPWLKEHVKEGEIQSEDGLRLHYYEALNPREKASLVMVHGFCEFFGKYHETAKHFYEAGYSVFFIELRGHGKSERTNPEEPDRRVSVTSFEEYVGDVHAFMEQVVTPHSLSHQYFLWCHSMGGAVGALYLEKYPDDFGCAVLSSPMLQVNYGKVPDAAVAALAVYTKLAHIDEKFAPGQHPFPEKPDYEHSNCDDEDRYYDQFEQREKDPDYQTWGGTYAWVRAARDGARKAVHEADRIHTPVLLCQAGNDHAVRLDGQERFVQKNPHTTILRYPKSKHELYNTFPEVREKYFSDVCVFLDAHVKSGKQTESE
jgi:lysophospholipase